MDESRKLYEDWFHSRYDSISMPPEDRVKLFTFSWAAWQASLAALEICIPKPIEGFIPGDYHIGYDAGCESQWESDIEAILAAGIKVKE